MGLRRTIRRYGVVGLVWMFLQRAFSPWGSLEFSVFYRKDLAHPIGAIPRPTNLSVRPTGEADIDDLAAIRAKVMEQQGIATERTLEQAHATVQNRFEREHICFAGIVGGELVHTNWIFTGSQEWYPPAGLHIALNEAEAYFGDAFTLEDWRGKGIHVVVHNEMLRYLKGAGFETVYTIIDIQNKPSRKAIELHEWKPCGALLYFTPRHSDHARMLSFGGNPDHWRRRRQGVAD